MGKLKIEDKSIGESDFVRQFLSIDKSRDLFLDIANLLSILSGGQVVKSTIFLCQRYFLQKSYCTVYLHYNNDNSKYLWVVLQMSQW